MNRIANAMEETLPYKERLHKAVDSSQRTKNDAIAISVAETALTLDVAAIVAFTQSGNTARRISKFRPKVPVIAVTFDEATQRSLALNWGVTTIISPVANNQNNECELARAVAREHGVQPGQSIILVAGYPVGNGATNTMKIIEVK
jgi:pyruvate kinase